MDSLGFVWEGTDNPNDPSGVATFKCDGIQVTVTFNDFATASRLSYLIRSAYQKGSNDAIARAQLPLPRYFDEQRYD